ncbi:peptidase M13 [Demequina sp. TTPB684]|uniref:M13 family metallopeptidase n=1 Tax=unclassified Demequina TaxID=2620311 RepID=UPI001CF2EEA7|nr:MULTISPECIES: M13-type metalloendopeptidase [unclassified Demequina]MCB2412772.1 peptidase M13 [Demequina sp. TTPB684]UPU87120.1 peptidase M13 [Demequina sp. TMPB413]
MTQRGIDPSTLSPTVRPQDDFFRYVNGPWLDKHKIPDDRAADGAFYALHDQAEKQVRAIIEESPRDQLTGALYASFMNTDKVDPDGAQPIQPDLAEVDAATSHEQLAATMGALQMSGVGGVVGYEVFADKSEPDRNVVYLFQSGIGLPDEAFYREDAHAEVREKYVAHLKRMADLTAVDFDADTVMAVETAIAAHHWDVVKSREADLTHNPTTLASLEETAGGFPWRKWADAIGMPAAAHDILIAYEPSFFEGLSTVFPATSLEDWKQWLRWRIVASRAAYLSQEISRANFEFYGTVLSGAPQQRERWKRGVQFVEGCVGELVGQLYVARHFPPEYKEEMDLLVAHLIAAYRESITSLEWMTPETRQRALAKLDTFTPKIGYPEKWRDYSELEANADDLVGNVRASSRFDSAWEWSKVGKPVDRTEWLMTPQTVNAYYLQTANEIVFPAAILQPPFFNPEADAAVNFGGIGAVIGHEIGHGFDDQGSKYDGTGRLDNWWTEADREAFTARAQVLIEQYNGYSPLQLADDYTVNGALTVGENIGDLAGVEIALKALKIAVGQPLDELPLIDGLTAVQRYFIAYALTERTKRRDEALMTQITTDPHSPEEFRINGVVRNMDAWYAAFGVSEEDALWLDSERRVRIW